MQISAAVIRQPGTFEIMAAELDDPRADEVRVRIVATGMCHTDLSVLDGDILWPLPAILGHEGAGVIDAVGESVTKVAVGDRVVLSFGSCGRCPRCTEGKVAYCDAFVPLNFYGRRLDGSHTHTVDGAPASAPFFYQSSFATYALASERNVIKAPDDLPLSVLAPLGCGIQTGAGAILNRLKPPPGSSLVIFGMGAVGLSALIAGVIAGCAPIVAVDLLDHRLALARDLGATAIARGDDPALLEGLRDVSGGGFDFAVEATGAPKVMAAATSALRKTGAAVLLGVPAAAEISFGADIMRGITIHSSIEGDSDPEVMIPLLIDLYRSGRFPYDRLIETFPFAAINDAVARSRDGSTVKPVLLIGEE